MEEIRKPVVWYESSYIVSNLWNICRIDTFTRNRRWLHLRRWKELSKVNMKWYKSVALHQDNIRRNIYVHRLVSQAFIPNPDNKPDVNHKNWIKNDNRVENLERCTEQENSLHSYHILWNNKIPWTGKFGKDCIHSVKISQYDRNNVFIRNWDSIADYARYTWRSASNISWCCTGKRDTAYWYKWKYFNS